MPRIGTKVPVLPETAARIVAMATLQPNGCRLTSLTPSKPRGLVAIWENGKERQVSATRVVAAVKFKRPIQPQEDVHHTCHTGRCVEPSHLSPIPYDTHSEHHAEELEQATCTVHQRPYDRRDGRGWGVCIECQREATRRWAARNPDKLRGRKHPPEVMERRRQQAKEHRSTPEYKAKAAAYQQARRNRIKREAEG